MRKLIIAAIAVGLTACGSTPQVNEFWVVDTDHDEFTDKSRCMVTTGSKYQNGRAYTENFKIYPFVEVTEKGVVVGVKSGGTHKIAVGDVQLRIDNNPARTLSAQNTPVELLSENKGQYDDILKALDESQREQFEKVMDTTNSIAAKMLAPFTAVDGSEAEKILKEMLSGNTLIYRQVGLTAATSTTGSFKLDPSLKRGLEQCGYSPG